VKYVVLIIDGASGWPVASLGGRTSLEAARIPNLDRLAREGTVGVADNVPKGMEASSAVACMSVMGFDPTVYYAGRGPIEATAMGIKLEPGQVAMRCNLVTAMDGRLVSYSAGGISSVEAAELIAALREAFADERLELYAGVGFRHILTVREGADLLATSFTPAHDVSDRAVDDFGPAGPGAALVRDLTERSKSVLAEHPVNKARIARGQLPATQVWLFWPGVEPESVPSFRAANGGRSAALTSAVDLLRGLAVQTGVDLVVIPGVTDGDDNDYEAQMLGALSALEDHDVVFVHVEAPDEASHAGDVEGKVRAIEQVDALMVPQVMRMAAGAAVDGGGAARGEGAGGGAAPGRGGSAAGGVSLLVLPDHPTPVDIKTHVAEPVPFVMWGPGFAANGAQAFTEKEARATGFAVAPGHLLLSMFLGGGSATHR
jgi:2,3-bisphosphoglycerate-independent phosphoglycerate mutase